MVAADADAAGALFYNRLFDIAPELKPMFKADITEQSKKLMYMIGYVINKLDKLDDVIGEVAAMAKRHAGYGVRDEHYTIVGSALLWTLEKGLAEHWTEEVKTAWITCYTLLSSSMIQAAKAA